MLKETYTDLLEKYTGDTSLINKLWEEIEHAYCQKQRHYHTLAHLDSLLNQLTEMRSQIQNWDSVLFTLFYHDVVYDTLKGNNEEKSAELAKKRMEQLSVASETIAHCEKIILATASHEISKDEDTNIFTDADLSILREPWEVYSVYCKNVRKEYSIYPDLLYNPGRKKVLKHFLEMDRIFKTAYFFEKYEMVARKNIARELEELK